MAIALAIVFVGFGAGAAVENVVDGIADRAIQYEGKLDMPEVMQAFHPGGVRGPARRYDRLTEARGTARSSDARAGELALWSLLQLAPWLAAAAALGLLVPILRAAGRGDPFQPTATRRMGVVGSLLLAGLPLYALLEYAVAEAATEGASLAPRVVPSLTLSPLHFLPGLLLLALAGIFHRGAELQDLERRTI